MLTPPLSCTPALLQSPLLPPNPYVPPPPLITPHLRRNLLGKRLLLAVLRSLPGYWSRASARRSEVQVLNGGAFDIGPCRERRCRLSAEQQFNVRIRRSGCHATGVAFCENAALLLCCVPGPTVDKVRHPHHCRRRHHRPSTASPLTMDTPPPCTLPCPD